MLETTENNIRQAYNILFLTDWLFVNDTESELPQKCSTIYPQNIICHICMDITILLQYKLLNIQDYSFRRHH